MPFKTKTPNLTLINVLHHWTFTNTNFLILGGSWKPLDCQSENRIAIVLPYRDRLENLNQWLFNMNPFLQRQKLDYSIFVVEQMYDHPFNKGILMNAAFKEIMLGNLSKKFDCIFYHDVDMIPTGNIYFSFFFVFLFYSTGLRPCFDINSTILMWIDVLVWN